MTTKIEERNSNNSGMTEAETEATETETWDMSDEEAEARAKHSNEGLADDYIYNIRSGIGQLTRDCEDPKIRVVLLNLLRFAEETYDQTLTPTVKEFSAEYPDGVVLPNFARHFDILSSLESCTTDVYFPEDSRFC